MPEEWEPVKGAFSGVDRGFRARLVGGPSGRSGLLGCFDGCDLPAPLSASAVCSTLWCAWSCLRHAPDRPGGGMVLFGLGQSWAQSHKSATPSVGGHADLELAVT